MKIRAFLRITFLFFLVSMVLNVGAIKAERVYPHDISLTSYMVKDGDTLWSLFEEDWQVVARINRVSPDALREGMILMIPLDMEKAGRHSPLPYDLPHGSKEEKVIFVDIELQALGAYENGVLLQWMPISSAEEGRITPRGEFRINKKIESHFSRTHPRPTGGAPMPYALRFITPYYWIHEGSLPGYPASKGCVRLTTMDAITLYHWANTGTKVVIK